MTYPIVAQQKLTRPVRRGVIPGLTRPRRSDDEIPKINPHEVLVYRVDGKFIVDDGRKGRDDGQVIKAINVSVVNMQRDARVAATFEIDSMDASKFTIRANFVCSVLDAATVVRNGLIDASEAILAYLNGYQPLFELGLKHPISDVNAVRRETGIHIKAYMTMKPPELAGISVHFANVQVDTPATIAEHEGKKRQAELDFDRKKREAEHEQALAMQHQAAQANLKLAEQKTEIYLQANQQTGALGRTRELSEAIDGDPVRAMTFAQVQGDLTAAEYMERLLALAQEKEQRAIEAENRERDLLERLELLSTEREDRQLNWGREDQVRQLDQAEKRADLEHERKLKKLEWRRQLELREREQEERRAERQRELADRRLMWNRDDTVRKLEFEQATFRREAEELAKRRREDRDFELEMLREFNKRGLLDNFYPDFDDLMSRIRGEESKGERKARKPIDGEEMQAITNRAEGTAEADETEQDDADMLTEENYES